MNPITPKYFNGRLKEKGLKIVCAESITAGLLASTIASVPGASAVLLGSIVTYNRDVKTKVLGVAAAIIDANTAESEATTVAMVNGLARLYSGAGLYVAVTGVASPPVDDYPATQPEGKIFVAILYKEELFTREDLIIATETSQPARRNEIRQKTVEFIFKTILEII